MAASPSRPPWGSPPPAAPSAEKSIGPLGVIALALGIGVFGYYMLDGHAHTCEACGNRWRHLGAFNLGDPQAHTCKQCGTVQWWKDGFPHVFRSPLDGEAARNAPAMAGQGLQEIRGVPHAEVPSGTSTAQLPAMTASTSRAWKL